MGNKDCEIFSGDGGLKDILQLLKEQSRRMERLGMALKVIQDGMRQSTLTTLKTSVGEAAEVLGSLFNTHECLVKSKRSTPDRSGDAIKLSAKEGQSYGNEGRKAGVDVLSLQRTRK